MSFPSSTIIIIVVILFAFYLIYSNNQPKVLQNLHQGMSPSTCQNCDYYKNALSVLQKNPMRANTPPITTVNIEHDNDPYSDPIKKQDAYSIMDPLTYPQMRLPREVLAKYHEYYEKHGTQVPFGESTQPLFDNPILNGILIKQVDENEPFHDNVPTSVPLFRVKSSKNTNRFFYYILDQRYLSKVELKIPLDHVKINGVRYNNADFYGLPELYDGDIIENIPIYPSTKFKLLLYRTYHFP